MNDQAIIDQIAAAVAARITPALPLDIDLWSAAEIAIYLKVSARQVSERYACLPDFPRPIRLPSAGGRGHYRWPAAEVIAWASALREKRRAA